MLRPSLFCAGFWLTNWGCYKGTRPLATIYQKNWFRSDHQSEQAITHRMNQVIADRVYSARLQLARGLS